MDVRRIGQEMSGVSRHRSQAGPKAGSGTNGRGSDKVELSGKAKEILDGLDLAKSVAALAEVRPERVREAQGRMAVGYYEEQGVRSIALAKLFEAMLGVAPKP